jgi:hypothetical protein
MWARCFKVSLDKIISFAVIEGRPLVQIAVVISKIRIGSDILSPKGPLVDFAALATGGTLPKNVFLDQIFTQCNITGNHEKLQFFFNHEERVMCTAEHHDLTAKFLADVKANPLTTLLTSYCVPLPASSGVVAKSLLEQEKEAKLRTAAQASADGDKINSKLHQETAKAKIDARSVKRSHAAAEETDSSFASMFAEEATEAPQSTQAASGAFGPTSPKASTNGSQKVAKHGNSGIRGSSGGSGSGGSSNDSVSTVTAENALTVAAIHKFGNLARAGFGESVIEGIRAFTVRMSDWDDVQNKSEEKVHLRLSHTLLKMKTILSIRFSN